MSRRRNSTHAPLISTLAWRIALPAVVVCGVFAPALAEAASLSGPVTGWASGVPSYISMYEYIPTKLAASPPVLVAAHYCGGSASAMFGFTGMPAIEAAADQYGFIMIFPQTTNPATSADCWDVGSKASLTHDGGGDTQAISEMVKYEVSKRNADATRVYMMGASSGAMLTEAMLAVYPDVFKAGAEFSGVPAGCWSDGWSAASNWGGTCATGKDIMTADAWGALVRGMYSGYTGYRPRIQLWHGTADATINFQNELEGIKEWTNVLGLSTNPTTNTMSTIGGNSYTNETWQSSSCAFTVLEAHEEANGGHTTPIDSSSVVSFFGLDKTGPDPQVAACGGSGNGGAGAGGGSSAGGTSSTGGTTGGGGLSAAGGAAGNNGVGGTRAGSGGEATTSGGSGTSTSGGTSSGNGGGATTSSNGGASSSTAGNASSNAGTSSTATGGNGDEPGAAPDSNSPNGCSCRTAGSGSGSDSRGAASLALLAFALSFVRRIRRKR